MHIPTRNILLLSIFILTLSFSSSQAQWVGNGVLVAADADSQRAPEICTDAAGGAILVWTDYRNADRDIYGQRLDHMGNRLWGATGQAVCDAAEWQLNPSLVADGEGGAFVAWADTRGVGDHTYIQHLDGDGTDLWDENGIWMDTGSFSARMHPDGEGGAFIIWGESSTVPTSIAAQRVSSSGTKLWPGAYQIIGTGRDSYLVPDGSGGCVVGWNRFQSTSFAYWVHGMRLDGNGTELWSDDGISPGYGCFFDTQIAADASGGGIWAWVHDSEVHVQRRAGDGTLAWGPDGILPFASGMNPGLPEVISDGEGGALVVVQGIGTQMLMNRILADGTLAWGATGISLGAADVNGMDIVLAPDGHGGVFLAWKDYRNFATTGIDIYAQHVDADGNILWTAGGEPICTVLGTQWGVRITPTGDDSAIITWEDFRHGPGNIDIYAQAIHHDGSIGNPPLKLQTWSPGPNRLDVSPYTTLSLTFNQDLYEPSMDPEHILVHGSISGRHTGSIVPVSSRGFRFLPDEPFVPGEVVQVVLTDGLESSFRMDLIPITWTFTIRTEGLDGELLAPVSYPAGDRPMSLCAGDIDGDGFLDLLAANEDDDTLTLRWGNGDGTFPGSTTLNAWEEPRHVITADMDEDGDLDIIAANENHDSLVIYLNDGTGAFPTAVIEAPGNSPVAVCAGDFDNDGILDLASVLMIPDQVAVQFGNGTGGVGNPDLYACGNSPLHIACGDVNNDGYLDLATANYQGNSFTILLNDGSGGFFERTTHFAGDGTNHVRLADLNDDRILDLVASGGTSNQIVMYRGDGTGEFSMWHTYATGAAPYVCQPGDMDGDGDLDLIHANGNSHNLWVRLNDGAGNFGTEAVYAGGVDPVSVIAADFDGDGALDVAAVNRYGDDFSVWLNHLSVSAAQPDQLPVATALLGNYPNPFNPGTRIDYALHRDGPVRLVVFDARGREVVTLVSAYQVAGQRSVAWDGRDAAGQQVASGVYFSKLVAAGAVQTRKMTLIR
jgi:hypothetical protein